MDGVREFLDDLKRHGQARGNFVGLLHILVGRRVMRAGGGVVSAGLTWREAATWLKRVRWPKESARELGIDPLALPPRDRERYWYQAIAQARIDSEEAIQAGDRLAEALTAAGYVVGPAPRRETLSH